MSRRSKLLAGYAVIGVALVVVGLTVLRGEPSYLVQGIGTTLLVLSALFGVTAPWLGLEGQRAKRRKSR